MTSLAIRAALLTACAALAAGCSAINAFRPDPLSSPENYRYLPDGTMILADTPAMWNDFRQTMDGHVANEAAGKTPLYQHPMTWQEFWSARIKAIRSNNDNPARYIDYIIQARRAAGLPELELANAGSVPAG